MKNKSLTYLLLGGVLLIWGLVFYRIFTGMDSGDEAGFVIPVKKATLPMVQEQEEKLILLANYRDPFLGSIPKPVQGSGTNTLVQARRKETRVIKEEQVLDWSFIDYIGLVYNKETKKNIGLLVLSGKEYMVNDKDVLNEVTVLKKERDSIWVEYKGVRKWIKR